MTTILKYEAQMNAVVDNQGFHKMCYILQFTESFQVCPLALHSNHTSVTSKWEELQLRPFYLYIFILTNRNMG